MTNPYVGEIRMFGGNFAPAGWMFCNGQVLAIADYDTLFNLIGTTYGGDGQTTFGLPDLQGRIPFGVGSGFVLGTPGGTQTVTLTSQQLPQHTHPPQAANEAGTASSPSGAYWAASAHAPYAPSTATTTPMNASAVGSAGGGQPHDNLAPFLALSFIISLFGIYPSQS